MPDASTRAREICRQAVAAAGGPAPLGRALGMSRWAADKWVVVPARHMAAVSRITGIPIEKLRPDLFETEDA